jgi:P27 family predicted phage terminase small subunit
MKGRKPKPVEQQMAEGDPAKRGVHKLEQKLASKPKATSGLPRCPRHLKGRARYAWGFWSEELAVMKIDKRPDGPMLEGACQQYARAVQADLIVDREGLVVTENFIDDEGKAFPLRIKKHPAVEISNRSWLIVKAFCSEFGLTPVSRTRLTLDGPGKGGSDDDELLKALSQSRNKPAHSSLIQ